MPARELAEDYGLTLNTDGSGLQPNVLVLAVKPQIIDPVMASLRADRRAAHAGHFHCRGHRHCAAVARARHGPGRAHHAQYAGADRQGHYRRRGRSRGRRRATAQVAEALLRAAGPVVWFDDEAQLDAVTAVSGLRSGLCLPPGRSAGRRRARRQGLPDAIAEQLARQTVIGSAALLEADPATPAVLRQNVTSPNGTTAAGLAVLMGEHGLTDLIDRTVDAARRRSEELGRG